MNRITLTKRFTTETSHRLKDYNGDCRNFHGHSYKWEVTVMGRVGEDGMVMDFKALNGLCGMCIRDFFDHAIVLDKEDFFCKVLIGMKGVQRIREFDGPPTAENMLFFSLAQLVKELRSNQRARNVTHIRVRVWETRDSYATSEWVEVSNES